MLLAACFCQQAATMSAYKFKPRAVASPHAPQKPLVRKRVRSGGADWVRVTCQRSPSKAKRPRTAVCSNLHAPTRRAFVHSAGTARTARAQHAQRAHITGIKWGFFATIGNILASVDHTTPPQCLLHNLMFDANPQSWAEPIQMSRMTFQCHRWANRSNGSVALLLVLTGVCRSLRSAPSFGPEL